MRTTTQVIALILVAHFISACAFFSGAPAPEKKMRDTRLSKQPPRKICPVAEYAYYLGGKRSWVKSMSPDTEQYGIASWYGKPFHGRLTANGERYDMHANTAAHKSLPMNSLVEVTNLINGKRTIVRINDRGPFIKGRIIDLSFGAANEIDMLTVGIAPIRVLVIRPGKRKNSRKQNGNYNL